MQFCHISCLDVECRACLDYIMLRNDWGEVCDYAAQSGFQGTRLIGRATLHPWCYLKSGEHIVDCLTVRFRKYRVRSTRSIDALTLCGKYFLHGLRSMEYGVHSPYVAALLEVERGSRSISGRCNRNGVWSTAHLHSIRLSPSWS